MIKLLITNGADMETKDYFGTTVIDLLLQNKCSLNKNMKCFFEIPFTVYVYDHVNRGNRRDACV